MSLKPLPPIDIRPEVERMRYCACADIIVTKAAENGVVRPNDRVFIWKKTAPNSNMISDFEPEVVIWSKLPIRSEQSPK